MKKLSKYNILGQIGRGGFATVYWAEDTTLGRQVALKVLDPLLMRDTVWVDRFRKEARTVAALDHPRIVPIYEIAEADGRLFIAMKLIDGPSLDVALAERGALPWEEAEVIVREIAAALGYAHGQGLLHRDLKPGNVLLHPEQGAVLTDFGFARMVSESSMSVSLSGGLVGTPHYLAPEIWRNQPATPASDLYALGCVLYEMVLGRKAFPGDTSPAVMTAHLLHPLDLPATWPEGVPAGLSEVLLRMLARDPEERLGQVADFVTALDTLDVDPLAELYTALEAAVADENWDEALRMAEDIRAQAPDYRGVEILLQQAQDGQDRIQRERLAGQWKAQARSALAEEQYEVARAAAEQWLQLSPEDPEALDILSQGEVVEETIDAVPSSNLEAVTNVVNEEATQLRTETNAESRKATDSVHKPTSLVKAEKLVFFWSLSNVVGLSVGGVFIGWYGLISGVGIPYLILRISDLISMGLISMLQGWILRTNLKWSTLRRDAWILVSFTGWVLGMTVFHAVVPSPVRLYWDVPRAGVAGAASGTLIGVLEWLVLRSYIRKAGWWILANMMGWALGWASFFVTSGFASYIVSLVMTGATGGLITGLAFVWLLKNRR
jgi:tetratricopeptide (TPR) repeat protein